MKSKKTKKTLNKKKVIEKNDAIKKNNTSKSLNFISDFSQALVIASIIILLTVSFVIVGIQKKMVLLKMNEIQNSFGVLNEVKIVKKAKASFGNLAISSLDNFNKTKGSDETLEKDFNEVVALSNSGLQTSAETSSGTSLDLGPSLDLTEVNSEKMIRPVELIKYSYVYVGEDFSLLPSEVEVYKKINPDLSKEFSNFFSNKKISFFDLKKFSNIGVNNLTINEDRDYGYSIYLGLQDSSFSIYKNWQKWPNLDKICASNDYKVSCYEQNSLTINDLLSDQEILNIANKFLSEYDIKLDNYASGVVQKSWLKYYINNNFEQSIYIPESISVIYPLKISDNLVYEDYGNFSGLTVMVDMRAKRVSELYNLSSHYYESSLYDTEQNKDAIMRIVNQGGRYSDYFYSEEEDYKIIDIEIGTPTLGMVKIWQYNNDKFEESELFVPAYIFPVIAESESSHFDKENIVIPAVKDFFISEDFGSNYWPIIMEEENVSSDFDNDNKIIEKVNLSNNK